MVTIGVVSGGRVGFTVGCGERSNENVLSNHMFANTINPPVASNPIPTTRGIFEVIFLL